MRIRFLSDQLYESEGRKKGPTFSKDEVVDARADFADRWLRRGVAEAVGGGKDTGDVLFVRVKGAAAGAAPAPAPVPATGQDTGVGAQA